MRQSKRRGFLGEGRGASPSMPPGGVWERAGTGVPTPRVGHEPQHRHSRSAHRKYDSVSSLGATQRARAGKTQGWAAARRERAGAAAAGARPEPPYGRPPLVKARGGQKVRGGVRARLLCGGTCGGHKGRGGAPAASRGVVPSKRRQVCSVARSDFFRNVLTKPHSAQMGWRGALLGGPEVGGRPAQSPRARGGGGGGRPSGRRDGVKGGPGFEAGHLPTSLGRTRAQWGGGAPALRAGERRPRDGRRAAFVQSWLQWRRGVFLLSVQRKGACPQGLVPVGARLAAGNGTACRGEGQRGGMGAVARRARERGGDLRGWRAGRLDSRPAARRLRDDVIRGAGVARGAGGRAAGRGRPHQKAAPGGAGARGEGG